MRDDSVDVMVLYHILEHIPDDATAMAEIARVIGTRGIAVVQVPWRPSRPTEEDPSAPEAERIRRFGQKDHVRYYGGDFVDRLRAAGLQVADFVVDRDLDAEAVEAGDLRGRLWLATGVPTDPSDWAGMIEAVVDRRGDLPPQPVIVDPHRRIRDVEHEVAKLRQRLMNEHLEARRAAASRDREVTQPTEETQEWEVRYEQVLTELRALESRRAAELETSALRLQAAYDSRSYRIGHALLTPLRVAKGIRRDVRARRGLP